MALVVGFLSGCISTVTPLGNTIDIQEVDFTQNFKTGESCALFFLLLGPFGDASIVTAAKQAGIAKASVVDLRSENYMLATRRCAIVYGQ
jgi:hypothetical protein